MRSKTGGRSKCAVMVNILFTQFYAFFYDQLNAVVGLMMSLILYHALSHLLLRRNTNHTLREEK